MGQCCYFRTLFEKEIIVKQTRPFFANVKKSTSYKNENTSTNFEKWYS